jgi:hypothetical protein
VGDQNLAGAGVDQRPGPRLDLRWALGERAGWHDQKGRQKNEDESRKHQWSSRKNHHGFEYPAVTAMIFALA